MAHINILPKNIADLIAAGEVVERPSSVIKEFTENSLDAGSKKITIEIKNGGKTYIRVTDDGCGMSREDVKKAFLSHATSKITKASDLDSISTLGFRGEALASICAVAKVDLMTTACGEEIGTRYIIEGGEEKLLDDVGAPVGTTIVVKDLFYNIPARLKFLKKDIQEGNAIASVIERVALSNPQVSFKFIRDGKIAFQTPGDGDLKSAIYAVFGKEFTSNLLPTMGERNGVTVRGFISKPIAGRGNRSMQIYFVNGRYIKSVVFMSALEAAYKNSIMVGRYPSCVLFVDMPYEAVDVNVHPAKTEVRFYDEKRVFDAVYAAALASLNEDKSRPQVTFNEAKVFTKPTQRGDQLRIVNVVNDEKRDDFEPESKFLSPKNHNTFVVKEYGSPITGSEDRVASPTEKEKKQLDFLTDDYYKPKVKIVSENFNDFTETNASKVNIDISVDDGETEFSCDCKPQSMNTVDLTSGESVDNSQAFNSKYEDNLDSLINDKIEYRYIGEAFSTYLIAELKNKIILIDKHAAHERILFEKFKNQGKGESQMMLMPVTINLSAEEYSAVMENIELLANAGYDVSDFGDRTIKLSSCPPQIVDEDLVGIMTEIAGYLANNIKTLMPEKLDWIYHSMACRAAVKAGNFTSREEAEKFVGTLLENDNIRYCPHGRPVLIEMTRYELEKQFKRIV